MKKLYAFLAILSIMAGKNLTAQHAETYHRSGNGHNTSNSTGYSGTGANIDVTYHRCDWNIYPAVSRNINGTVTTYFTTTVANVNQVTFDLNGTSFNNGSLVVRHHGTVCTVSFPSTNVLRITLPVTLTASGTKDSVSITYSGTPPAVNGQAEGYQRGQDGNSNWYIYTLSESYEDRDWWPCKADMQDKIDSIDINITTASDYWAAANGKLVDSAISGSNRTFKFQHRYACPSYLVAIGVAKYNRFYRGTVNISGKQVPVAYYLFPDLGSNPTSTLNRLDVSKQELVEFSNLFGPYPFADEKHGYYQFGWGGGMEHQTFSAMGSSALASWSTIAHELGHQWFGDKVSFATWNHLWLAEGFAKYAEVLAAEKVPATGASASTQLSNIKTTARNTSNTTIFLNNTNIANSNAIWTTNNDNAIYQRGAMVVSMLRAMLGDAKFFQACRNYLSDPLLAYRSATTADLQRHMENMAGEDLSPFFNAWIYGAGNPSYTGQYYVNNKYIQFKFTQSRTGGAVAPVSHFPMPIVIKISNSGGTQDTTVVIYHHTANELAFAGNGVGQPGADIITYNLSFVPASVSFDPGNVTMATGTLTPTGTVLAVSILDFKAKKVGSSNQVDLAIANNEPVTKIVLAKSFNGIDFTDIGEMNKLGSTAGRSSYRFDDGNPFSPVTYYRAKIITATKTELTGIVKVQNTIVKAIAVSPNPASEMINITFSNSNKEKTTVQVISMDGKKVIESSTTNDFIHYDVSSLASGTYMVNIIQEGQVSETTKFLVKR